MLSKTKAIVLHKTNYSESSIVVQLFTFDFGRVSILVQGAKRKKSAHKIALFEPLTLLEVVGNFEHPERLIKTREIKLHTPFIHIPSSIAKRSIALFVSEILQKCIREPHPEKPMFLFIENALNYLEATPNKVANFHLVFMMKLSKYLGFFPQLAQGTYFDLEEGVFTKSTPRGKQYLVSPLKDHFYQVLGTDIDKSDSLLFSGEERRLVLESMIDYYKIHVSGFKEIKSHQVLEAIFN